MHNVSSKNSPIFWCQKNGFATLAGVKIMDKTIQLIASELPSSTSVKMQYRYSRFVGPEIRRNLNSFSISQIPFAT